MNDAAHVSAGSSVTDYASLVDRLCVYMRSVCPLVIVRTTERHRVERALAHIVKGANGGLRAFSYTDSRQIVVVGDQKTKPRDVSSDPLPAVMETFTKFRNTTFLLADTRRMDQDCLYTRELVAAAYLAKETHNTLVLVTADNVWQRLAGLGMFIDLRLPTFNERRELIEHFRSRHPDQTSLTDTGVAGMAIMLRGLTEVQITNLLRAYLVAHGSMADADVNAVCARKEVLFTPVSNITPVEYPSGLQVVGLDNLKVWLNRKRRVFFASTDELHEHALQPPRGVLLMGVPGCGKSFSAKMVASQWRLPLFRFDLGEIYDKYIGETERKMREALEYIDNVAPCVLWIDEIEKALSTGSGESDVGNRVLGQFLFWLQESDAKVFLVATANSVSAMPPELFRKGRFSGTFFLDLPNTREREQAIDLYCGACLGMHLDADHLAQAARTCEGFTYSDIEQCVKDVAEWLWFPADHDKKDAHRDTEECYSRLLRHFRQTKPIDPKAVESIRKWGRDHAMPASAPETR